MKTVIPVSFDSEEDKDLLAWIQGTPKGQRSEKIRTAIRAHLGRGGEVSLGDVYDLVRAIERRLQSGMIVATSAGAGPAGDEPEEAALALDDLGK